MKERVMNENVRPSVLAGTAWYPGSLKELRKTIDLYFANVKQSSIQGKILGLISPHAGFEFSGQVASYGYKLLSDCRFDLVVVVSPLHRLFSDGYLTSGASFYETPLGKVPVDSKSIDALSKEVKLDSVFSDNEHSLEIQLPFLQVALSDFKLLPIMVGMRDVYSCEDIVTGLLKIVQNKKTLFIASSDLHHESNYEEVVRKDKKVVDTLTGHDLEKIRSVLAPPECTVCGKVPISIVLDVTKRLGADRFKVLCHTNSGDVTGEKQPGQYTVGYLSAAVIQA
jgi:AmmeMemoRadiSam system protein B